ncbi:MAG: saccharopine dehydrogenase C-terminal domain-containing protein [Fimbriimonadales bacterium]
MKALAVVGAGMQGVAAAYDCALNGSFDRIALADCDIERAVAGADRINSLLRSHLCEPFRIDAASRNALHAFLPDFEIAVSALPYAMHALVEDVGIEVVCSVVDMGQDVEPARAIHSRDREASAKGVTVVTDCGLAPGLVNIFAAELIARCPGATHVRSYCGGLPEMPIGPLGYVLRFSMDSVIGEYSDEILALRAGEVVTGKPLDLLEEIEFGGVGRLEAFTTSGGTGTAPYSLQGRVPNYEYKTLRYPGHLAAMNLFRDCGFWSEAPVARIGVSAREAFSAVMEQNLARPEIGDMVLVRVEAEAPGRTLRLEMIERPDPVTGFTAMERLTGFSTSIVAIEISEGRVPAGCSGCEVAVDPDNFRCELQKRGFGVRSVDTLTA